MSEISREEALIVLRCSATDILGENAKGWKNQYAEKTYYALDKAISDMEKMEKIEEGKSDFEELERKMCRYFNMVDMLKEKTELEKLALDIVCIGMQTMGCLNGILEN